MARKSPSLLWRGVSPPSMTPVPTEGDPFLRGRSRGSRSPARGMEPSLISRLERGLILLPVRGSLAITFGWRARISKSRSRRPPGNEESPCPRGLVEQEVHNDLYHHKTLSGLCGHRVCGGLSGGLHL